MQAYGAYGVGGKNIQGHTQAHMSGFGQGFDGAVGRQGVGKQGNAFGGKGFMPNLHQRQGGILQVFAQYGGKFLAAVA